MKAGTLYFVPLPIGNLEDVTLRALRVLASVDLVAAEDTRNFHELCSALKINPKRVVAYHDHNETESAEGLIQLLLSGQSVAIVSDAGTPGIADPGYSILLRAYENNICIEPLAGPSSLTAALSACPLGGSKHVFMGFASSKKSERIKELQSLAQFKTRAVFFESPHRILEHLEDAANVLGDLKIFIAREITKRYQEYLFLNISDLIRHFKQTQPKGEFVVIYPGVSQPELGTENLTKLIKSELEKGRTSKEVLDIVKGQSALSRSDVYDMIQKVKDGLKNS